MPAPKENTRWYVEDPIGSDTWVLRSEVEIVEIEADIAASIEADRLVQEYAISLAAKEAKKEPGLDQKVIDKLTAKEKN